MSSIPLVYLIITWSCCPTLHCAFGSIYCCNKDLNSLKFMTPMSWLNINLNWWFEIFNKWCHWSLESNYYPLLFNKIKVARPSSYSILWPVTTTGEWHHDIDWYHWCVIHVCHPFANKRLIWFRVWLNGITIWVISNEVNHLKYR
jgi:hypothetical protein